MQAKLGTWKQLDWYLALEVLRLGRVAGGERS